MVQGRGIGFATIKPNYATYKSPYGPSYKIQPNIRGYSAARLMTYAGTAGAFGVVAGVFALQFFSEIPKLRNDICANIPIIGDYFERSIAPEDNPF